MGYKGFHRHFRVYGPGVNHDSWSRVARGIRGALAHHEVLAGYHQLEDTFSDLDDGLAPGCEAMMGIYIGPPSRCSVMRGRGSHDYRAVMIAANSSWLPDKTMRVVAKEATELLAPSHWSAAVVQRHSQGLPVTVYRHGVAAEFKPDATAPAHGRKVKTDPYFVLHMASTTKQRKASVQTAAAFVRAKKRCRIPLDAQLHMFVSGPPGPIQRAVEAESEGDRLLASHVMVLPRQNWSEAGFAAVLQRYDLVCQPSRAEGFGLVPLEARACGIPVCVTACTGHSEHISEGDPGVCIVPHHEDAEIDDGPGALAPTVSLEGISRALGDCYAARLPLHDAALAAAADIRQKWSWEAVTAEWLDQM